MGSATSEISSTRMVPFLMGKRHPMKPSAVQQRAKLTTSKSARRRVQYARAWPTELEIDGYIEASDLALSL